MFKSTIYNFCLHFKKNNRCIKYIYLLKAMYSYDKIKDVVLCTKKEVLCTITIHNILKLLDITLSANLK